MSGRFVCGGAFPRPTPAPPAPFVLKHYLQNWNFWGEILSSWNTEARLRAPEVPRTGILPLRIPQGFENDLDLMYVPWTKLPSHVPSSQFNISRDLAFCPLSSGFIERRGAVKSHPRT